MCEPDVMPAGSVGWIPPGVQVEAVVLGLRRSYTYYYVIEDTRFNTSTPVRKLVTGPRRNAPTDIIVFGDMGQSMDVIDGSMQHSWDFKGRGEISAPNTTRLVRSMLDDNAASLICHIGDISYATGALALWDTWLDQVEPITSQVAYMTAIGNHEMGWTRSAVPGSDSQGECGIPYVTYFPFSGQSYNTLPRDPPPKPILSPSWRDPWYSFNHGNAHITIMSTEHDFSPDSDQYKWLKHDLAAVKREHTPWLLFMGHRPMYVSSDYGGDHDKLATDLQQFIEPLFVQFKVDMAFWGHHHSYQRSRLIEGVQHIVVGSAGFAFSPIKPGGDEHFLFATNTTWGVSRVRLVNDTAAQVQFYSNADYSLQDAAWVVRGAQQRTVLQVDGSRLS